MIIMWNKIKRWFWRKGIIKCKHDWVPAREFYKWYNGHDCEFLEPTPMKYHPGYQAAPYVCKKCYDSCVMIEEIETGKQMGGATNDLRV